MTEWKDRRHRLELSTAHARRYVGLGLISACGNGFIGQHLVNNALGNIAILLEELHVLQSC